MLFCQKWQLLRTIFTVNFFDFLQLLCIIAGIKKKEIKGLLARFPLPWNIAPQPAWGLIAQAHGMQPVPEAPELIAHENPLEQDGARAAAEQPADPRAEEPADPPAAPRAADQPEDMDNSPLAAARVIGRQGRLMNGMEPGNIIHRYGRLRPRHWTQLDY